MLIVVGNVPRIPYIANFLGWKEIPTNRHQDFLFYATVSFFYFGANEISLVVLPCLHFYEIVLVGRETLTKA
jgi:hypothetical protein